jgi:hypothetical protein
MYSEISPVATLPEVSPVEVDPVLIEVINSIGAEVLHGSEVRMAEEEPAPEPVQEPQTPPATPAGLPVRAPDPNRETPGTTTKPGEQESEPPQIDDPRAR